MKIIFSRKGFDSQYGGIASPIIAGRPITLPIPAADDGDPSVTTYADIQGEPSFGRLASDLTKGKLNGASRCHMDPDLEFTRLPRSEGWRGNFGQSGGPLGHLMNQDVRAGDLFLFFGLFADAEIVDDRWKIVGTPHHRIFGWLAVGETINLSHDKTEAKRQSEIARYPWLDGHPHILAGYQRRWPGKNAIYVAAHEFKVDDTLTVAGCGVLKARVCLSAPDQPHNAYKKSLWAVPDWLNPKREGCGLSYHGSPSRWSQSTLQSVAKGQEFVANVSNHRAEAAVWLKGVLEEQAQ